MSSWSDSGTGSFTGNARDADSRDSFQQQQWSASGSYSSSWLHPLPQRHKPVDRVAFYQCVNIPGPVAGARDCLHITPGSLLTPVHTGSSVDAIMRGIPDPTMRYPSADLIARSCAFPCPGPDATLTRREMQEIWARDTFLRAGGDQKRSRRPVLGFRSSALYSAYGSCSIGITCSLDWS